MPSRNRTLYQASRGKDHRESHGFRLNKTLEADFYAARLLETQAKLVPKPNLDPWTLGWNSHLFGIKFERKMPKPWREGYVDAATALAHQPQYYHVL